MLQIPSKGGLKLTVIAVLESFLFYFTREYVQLQFQQPIKQGPKKAVVKHFVNDIIITIIMYYFTCYFVSTLLCAIFPDVSQRATEQRPQTGRIMSKICRYFHLHASVPLNLSFSGRNGEQIKVGS